MPRNRTALALATVTIALIALVGCSKSAAPAQTTAENAAAAQTSLSGLALGKQIYTKGLGANGEEIAAEAPTASQGALMLGGGGCAACHGVNGRGGAVRAAAGAAIAAPNITYAELKKAGYSDVAIQYAITWCQDETGAMLDETMPCWQMTDAEAQATVAYLKTLR